MISCFLPSVLVNGGRTCWADRERGRVTPKRMSSHAGGDIGLWNLYLILPKCMDENIYCFFYKLFGFNENNELYTPITEAAQVGHTNRFLERNHARRGQWAIQLSFFSPAATGKDPSPAPPHLTLPRRQQERLFTLTYPHLHNSNRSQNAPQAQPQAPTGDGQRLRWFVFRIRAQRH